MVTFQNVRLCFYPIVFTQFFSSVTFLFVPLCSFQFRLVIVSSACQSAHIEYRMQILNVYRIYNVALSDTKLRSLSAKPYAGLAGVTVGDRLSVRISPSGTHLES